MPRLLARFLFSLCVPLCLCGELFAADEPHVVYVGAEWCGPCRGAKKFTIPELIKAGVKVEELDFDKDKLPAEVTDVPTYFVIVHNKVVDTIVGHVHQDVILAACKKYKPLPSSSAARQEPRPPGPSPPNTNPLDLVAQLRRFLGTKKPKSHSSIAWAFEEAAEISVDHKTTITRPKHLDAEIDFDGDIVTITFGGTMPQAHVVKAGATISVDITRVVIRKNVVTATADIAFGLKKDFEIVVTQSPFDD